MPTLQYIDQFTVTGFCARTKNSDEFNPDTAKIPSLWQRFYASDLARQSKIFGVYSGYASDANGEYIVTAGSTDVDVSVKLNSVIIQAGNYLVFEGKGAMPQAVISTWQEVWNFFSGETQYQRLFATDFERYLGSDGVEIYIGVL